MISLFIEYDKCATFEFSNIVSKGLPQKAEVALRIPCGLRPRILSTFGKTRVEVRQPNAPDTFTPGEILGTHF
jgi:hypothetical protein